jgi:hypothetical protein
MRHNKAFSQDEAEVVADCGKDGIRGAAIGPLMPRSISPASRTSSGRNSTPGDSRAVRLPHA